jgi:beta-glucosidase
MPGPTAQRKLDAVKASIEGGELKTEAINSAARNVLNLLKRAGKFEKPEIPAEQSIVSPEHAKLIREAGHHGTVLLKNDKQILPLTKDKLKSVAAVGLAKDCLAHGGGSAMVNCHYRRTPYDTLKEILPESTDLRYAKGAKTFRSFPDLVENVFDLSGKPGFTLSKYGDRDMKSQPKAVKNLKSGTFSLMMEKNAAAKIEAEFRPQTSGSHHVAINSLGSSNLFINDEFIISQDTCTDPMGVLFGGAQDATKTYAFEAGKTYKLRFEAVSASSEGVEGLDAALLDGMIATRLCFMTEQEHDEDLLTQAVEVAKGADVVLAFIGNTSVWETEGTIRPPKIGLLFFC